MGESADHAGPGDASSQRGRDREDDEQRRPFREDDVLEEVHRQQVVHPERVHGRGAHDDEEQHRGEETGDAPGRRFHTANRQRVRHRERRDDEERLGIPLPRVRIHDATLDGRGCSQLVERQPSKLDVAGSSPVARSRLELAASRVQGLPSGGASSPVANGLLESDYGGRTMDPPLGVRLGAEALGTFLFFFLGFSGIAVVVDIGADAITPVGVAAGFGFGLALAITAFGHLSGGHFNPAVSAGLAIAGRFKPRDVIPYWIAQLVGGFGAVLVMAIVYSGDVTDALDTAPGSGIDNWAALVLEIITTALFVMVILTVATDERAAWNGVMAPFLIGLFIFTAASVVGPASGGSFNPARSLDPVLYNQDWGKVWIYIVGPLAGGVLGGAIWAYICLRRPMPDPQLEVAREGLEP